MVKTKSKIKTKDELLEMMNEHLSTQQNFAQKLKEKAESFIDDEDGDNTKKKNHYLNAYNCQVDAVSRTSATMIRILNSPLKNEESEEEDSSDSLVD